MKTIFVMAMASLVLVLAGCAYNPGHGGGSGHVSRGAPSLMEWAQGVPGADRKYHERDASCRWDYYGRDCRAYERAGSSHKWRQDNYRYDRYRDRRFDRRYRHYHY